MEIYIDIETCPSQSDALRAEITKSISPPGNISKAETIALWNIEKKPQAIEDALLKTSFSGLHGHICVIGLARNDNPPMSFFASEWLESEAENLRNFYAAIDEICAENPNERPVFIGHNLIGFDLKFIQQRSIVLGVTPSRHLPANPSAYGRDSAIFDTMLRWDSDRQNYTGLDKLCKAMGIEGKGGISGSDVWPMVRDGRIAEVAAYCEHDVSITRALYKRMTFAPPPVVKEVEYDDGLPF